MDQNGIEQKSQLVKDFVFEFLENLGRLEVNLIELEQNPTDFDAIDTIFRDFHSLKALSAFLGLGRINILAHNAENLMAKAGKGQIRVERDMVDVILDAVDMLKCMIEDIHASLVAGEPVVSEIDPKPLIDRIEAIQGEVDQIGEKPLGEILVTKGAVSRDEIEAGLARQKADPRKKLGHILVEDKKARTKEVISALRDQRTYGGHFTDLQLKVDTKKIDRFIDLTMELASCQEMLRNSEWSGSGERQKPGDVLNRLSQLTSQLQRTALSMRMVSLNNTFQRMVRLVRDLSVSLGKEIALVLAGEDTEIDSAVAGELYEPMVHIIRNAVDHGIEMPEERERSSKDRMGTIHLEAFHEGHNVIVEISDDGRGLKLDQIMQWAKANGFITEGCRMSEAEIYRMICQPGFSTATNVTALSGRGMGMDVAKRVIEKFGGRLDVQSMPGSGSTFRIQIPRTVDISQGSLVKRKKVRAETLKSKGEAV